MSLPECHRAIAYAHARLSHELSPLLTYHSLTHTRDDVAPAAVALATDLGLDAEALLLVRTAAWFHDIGFVLRMDEHEAAGVAIAEAVLPTFGYSAEQVALVAGMIMATRLPQSPRTLAEQIVADADLSMLGRDIFWKRADTLRAERAAHGQPTTDAEWYTQQVAFVGGHTYWTSAAQARFEEQKRRHVAQLIALRDAARP